MCLKNPDMQQELGICQKQNLFSIAASAHNGTFEDSRLWCTLLPNSWSASGPRLTSDHLKETQRSRGVDISPLPLPHRIFQLILLLGYIFLLKRLCIDFSEHLFLRFFLHDFVFIFKEEIIMTRITSL